tara:strand:- start:21 stop:326 length:306 start_codon:yes stop_codon:yes gene_type:complete
MEFITLTYIYNILYFNSKVKSFFNLFSIVTREREMKKHPKKGASRGMNLSAYFISIFLIGGSTGCTLGIDTLKTPLLKEALILSTLTSSGNVQDFLNEEQK